MLSIIRRTLRFLTTKERRSYFRLVASRATISFLDLAGIAGIGYLATSVAMFLTAGSDPSRTLKVVGLEIPAANIKSLPVLVAAILVLFAIKAVAAIFLTKALGRRIALVEARAAKLIAKKLLGGNLIETKRYSREEIIYAVQNGSPAAFNGVLNNVATLTAEGALFAVLLVTFFSVNWGATLGLITYFGLIALAMHLLIGSKSQRASEVISQKTIEANRHLGDLYSAFRELAVLGRRASFFEKIYLARKATAMSVGDQMYLAGMPRYIIETSLLLGVLIFGLFQSQSSDLVATATTLGIFLTGGLRVVAAMLPLQNAAVSLKETMSPARAALDVLDKLEAHKPSSDICEIPTSEGPVSVVVEAGRVNYPGQLEASLGPLSLNFPAGSQVAIIGASGAGKSTLADVIVGLLPLTAGKTTLDGYPTEYYVATHPGSVAYVPQEPGRVSGTISQNIAIGISPDDINQQALEDAISAANLTSLVNMLPAGVHTDLGKHSDALSGGQLQRLGLARALYSSPGLLVMDEATSSLDAITEHEISLALERLRGKTTVILIAHRLNTVKNADEVIYLENGLVKDKGPFRDLQKRLPEVALAASLMSAQ